MAMRAAAVLVIAAACLPLCAGSAYASTASVPGCDEAPRVLPIVRDAVSLHVAQTGLVEIQEVGHLVTVRGAPVSSVSYLSTPYRYGTHRVRLGTPGVLELARTTVTGPDTIAVSVRSLCSVEAGNASQDWFTAMSSLATEAATRPTPARADEMLELVHQLETVAPNPDDAARATHLRAQILLMAGRSERAEVAFATAASAWRERGRPDLERVAQAGQMEELFRLARHDDALALARSVPLAAVDSDYFAARLRMGECLALRYAGDMPAAAACFQRGLPWLDALGETMELVSAQQDYADVLRFLGDLDAARLVGEAALAASTLPAMEWPRGRLQLTLGAIAQDTGDIEQALIRYDAALTEFDLAKATRWEANALLVASNLYAALGANEEALDFIEGARALLNERDAPSRIGSIEVASAKVWMALGDNELAQTHLERARVTFERLALPAELDVVGVLEAQLLGKLGRWTEVRYRHEGRDPSQTLNITSWQLVAASAALELGDCPAARKQLETIDLTRTSIGVVIEASIIEASCLEKAGDASAAENLLQTRADALRTLAMKVRSPLLSRLVMRRALALRQAALSMPAPSAIAPHVADRFWDWQQRTRVPGGALSLSPVSEFDRQITTALSEPAPGSIGPSRALLANLASGDAPRKRTKVLALPELQARLAAGDMYLSSVDVAGRNQLFWATRERSEVIPGRPTVSIQQGIAELSALLDSTDHSVAEIEAAAQHLARLVLPEQLARHRPSRLYVDAESDLAKIPWTLLSWPSSDRPLVEQTSVTLTRLTSTKPAASEPNFDVAVFAAGSALPDKDARLWNADSEVTLIAEAIKPLGGSVTTLQPDGRQALIDAFARRTPWLHIAAHGETRSERLGHAGIWLGAGAGTAPPSFVSWLSALSGGASNDLVVLNACSLGSSAGNAFGMSFADALSGAGVADVVAARWQVSDAASRRWVPAFYSEVLRAGAADAMRKAQLELRRDRQFRHPYYWATYAHFGRF
jgi:CHAT domain-containing protein/tetratricopeptide (TPR) repeat protein